MATVGEPIHPVSNIPIPEFNENNSEFFDSRLLSVSRQWRLIYKTQFEHFLKTFKLDSPSEDESTEATQWSHYQKAALDIARYNVKHLLIEFQHIVTWIDGADLAAFIRRYFLSLWKDLDEVVDVFVKETLRRYFQSEIVINQGLNQEPEFLHDLSAYERSSFHLNFTLTSNSVTVRQLRTDVLGELITLRGTTTRMSDVRPELRTASFECASCHTLVENVEQQFKYTEPIVCSNRECRNRTLWRLRPESCRFADWQKLRLQENSSEIPAGSMPRAIEVILTKNLTDRCKPGDKIVMTGTLAAIPDVPSLMKPGEVPRAVAIDRNRLANTEQGLTDASIRGLKELGVRDLSYRLVFFALDVVTVTSGLDAYEQKADLADELAEEEFAAKQHMESVHRIITRTLGLDTETEQLFLEIAHSTSTLDKLAATIAPEIFGCEPVKKGILLMLVGGIEKHAEKDQLKLRGDINVCIVGDPGTAKSQLLKFVHTFASGRSVYTAGNTSTAAGLTVSIHKDPDQGDSVIEAGALMLADQGICCIDEFDKMNVKDMVAIHEAMEQKTISICKAGIQATLNARASILAACNPRYGRYDLSKSFRQNIKLSQAIISRFDLFFTMIDDTERDALIARHLVNLHMTAYIGNETKDYPASTLLTEQGLLSREKLRKYLAVARSCNPCLTEETKQILVDSYVALRTESLHSLRNSRVTVRQLESLIRLSEAVAKLKFSNRVLPVHVREARKIMQSSFIKMERGEVTLDDDDNRDDDSEDESSFTGGGEAKIDTEKYETITRCLIDRLRSLEYDFVAKNDQDQQTSEAIIAKDDLIGWYIENIADSSITESLVKTENLYKTLSKIIHRMINRDFTLIEEMREMNVPVGDGEETEVQCIPALRLHPNLAVENGSEFHVERSFDHATLPTAFYATSTTDKKNASWVIDDQNFMEYMYQWNER